MKNEEKNVVKVLSDDHKKLVIEAPDGGEKTFYLNPIRSMWLRVEQAEVVKSASSTDTGLFSLRLLEGKGAPDLVPDPLPELALYVVGTAVLEQGCVGLIGEPAKASRSLRIRFNALNEEDSKLRADYARERGTPFWPQVATIGFTSAD